MFIFACFPCEVSFISLGCTRLEGFRHLLIWPERKRTLDTPQIKHVHAHIVLQECQAEQNSVWWSTQAQAGKIRLRVRKIRDTVLSSFHPCSYAFPHNHVMLSLLIHKINLYKRNLGHRHGSCHISCVCLLMKNSSQSHPPVVVSPFCSTTNMPILLFVHNKTDIRSLDLTCSHILPIQYIHYTTPTTGRRTVPTTWS